MIALAALVLAAVPAVYVHPLGPAAAEQRAAREVHGALVEAMRKAGITLEEVGAAAARVRVASVERVTTEEPDPRPKRKPVKVRTPGRIHEDEVDREAGVTRQRWNEVRVVVELTCGGDAAITLEGPVRETSARDAGRALGRALARRLKQHGVPGACRPGPGE